MREASTVACNERMISTICAMVMAATPSAATGATGLERLLLIFLMKLDESQNATNNTSFSDDQLSDQSVTTAQNSAGKLKKNAANLHRNLQLHQKPPLLPRKAKRTKELESSPNKTRPVRRELHLTEQNSK